MIVETQGERGAHLAMFAAAGAAFAWGVGPLAVRAIDAPVAVTAFWRLWIAVPLMFLLARSSGSCNRKTLRLSIVPGVLFAGSLIAGWGAIRTTSVANATIIPSLQPVLVLLIASKIFGETVRKRDFVLGAVALIGVLAFIVSASETSGASRKGDLFAVAGLIIWVSYFVITKQLRSGRDDIDTLPLLAGVMFVAALVATPYVLVAEGIPKPILGVDLIWVLFIVVVPGVLGHGLMTWAQRHATASLLSIVMLGSPIVSAFGAWIFFNQALLPTQLVAAFVVLSAVSGVVVSHRSVPVEIEAT
ncbi:MAG: DMT family transporter [Acidimicrobiia bacterium]|nr:DMT family transporter [Acidimicrobiia bacterium]